MYDNLQFSNAIVIDKHYGIFEDLKRIQSH